MKNKKNEYINFKPPRLSCKYCKKEMQLTDYSKSLFENRGPYHATYLYRCACTPDEVQVLPIDKYPKIGELYHVTITSA